MDPIADAVAAVRSGRLIVFPTDTVYGIGTMPQDAAAITRLFEAKDRPRDLTLPVLTASLDAARALARFDDRAERLAAALWPGALTLVLPRTDAIGGWDLGGDGRTIGVRVPSHPLALAVLAAAGPLATTSANRSGDPPAESCDELHATFGIGSPCTCVRSSRCRDRRRPSSICRIKMHGCFVPEASMPDASSNSWAEEPHC